MFLFAAGFAKLALQLRKQGKNPLLIAADVYRPAAIEQLKTYAKIMDLPLEVVATSGAAGSPVGTLLPLEERLEGTLAAQVLAQAGGAQCGRGDGVPRYRATRLVPAAGARAGGRPCLAA